VEAILVTFQDPVILRGVAIRMLREVETPIRESEHYTYLKSLSLNVAKSSPWECFFAAIEGAAEAPDRASVLKQLDEAEMVLLTLVQVRHEMTTGVRANYNDLRRSYLGAVESRVRGDAGVALAETPSPPKPRALSYERRLANAESRYVRHVSDLPVQFRQEGDMRPPPPPKMEVRDLIATVRNFSERLQSALADWHMSRLLAALCLGAFALSMFIATSLFVEYRNANSATRVSALQPAADTRSGPAKPPSNRPPKAAAAPQMARIVHGVNVHTEPVNTGEVFAILPRGLRVAIVERNGKWVRIRADGKKGEGKPVIGWVFNTFLTVEDPTAQTSRQIANN
jgi:SH3 domain-containing protein